MCRLGPLTGSRFKADLTLHHNKPVAIGSTDECWTCDVIVVGHLRSCDADGFKKFTSKSRGQAPQGL